jgi:hypothetical protein
MPNEATALDVQARRAAKRVHLHAVKSRARQRSADNRGRFMLSDPFRNTPVAGERFDLEPEDVIAICETYEPRR